MSDVLLVLVLLLSVALLLVGLLYLHYHNTPAAQWKARVRAAVNEQEARGRLARRELNALVHDDEDRILRNEFLTRQLEAVAVEDLARYPGIGPVTVSRLRDAGLATVAACTRARLSAIDGIGPVREKDLKEALKQVRREAESRFDAGASPQAVAYRGEMKKRQAERDRRRQAAEAAIKYAETGLAALQEQAQIADGVTFFGHLTRRRPVGLNDEMMNRPLAMPAEPPPPPVTPPAEPEGSAREAATPADVALAPASGSAGPPPLPPAEASPFDRLRIVAGFGYAMAKADGRIAAAERRQVRAFVERRYFTPDLGFQLDSILAEVEADLPTLSDALWEVKRSVPADAWRELYQFAESVADSAGERNTREVECLARVAEELGINVKPPPAHVPSPVVATESDAPLTEPDCRAALEIASETPMSVELIRRQYRLLSDRFAPARFADHGPEFVTMAAEKRERAERAARHLLSEYNEPLEPPTAPPPADLRHNPDLDDVFGA